jgi:glucose/arabinose dehydrogenase
MNTTYRILIVASIAMITACANKINQPTDKTDHTTTGTSPVETEPANSNYQPAFPGQTRIAGVHTQVPYQVEMLSKNLNKPWGLTVLPDGRFLITEKAGVYAHRLR